MNSYSVDFLNMKIYFHKILGWVFDMQCRKQSIHLFTQSRVLPGSSSFQTTGKNRFNLNAMKAVESDKLPGV